MIKLCFAVFIVGTLGVSDPEQKKCNVDHFWRPFYGDIPSDAFIAGYNGTEKPVYVLQIVPPDEYLWTTIIGYSKGQKIRFGWHQYNDVMDITHFVKILCYDQQNTLEWRKIHQEHAELRNKCCLVEGGFGKYPRDHKNYVTRIGRVVDPQGVSKIGRSYDRFWDGIHLDFGKNSSKVYNDYEVLAYGCNDQKSDTKFNEFDTDLSSDTSS